MWWAIGLKQENGVQTLPRLSHFQITQFQTWLINSLNTGIKYFSNARQYFHREAQWDESGWRILLTDNTGGGYGHAADQVPVLESGFQLDSFVNRYTVARTYNIMNFDLRKIRLVPDLPERYCVGGCLYLYSFSTRFGSECAARKVWYSLDGLE